MTSQPRPSPPPQPDHAAGGGPAGRGRRPDPAADPGRHTNLPGDETPAAPAAPGFLADAGVEGELVARDPDRANLVARIPGTGDGRRWLSSATLDVVPADARDWMHPPFEAVVDDDGYLHGRGAVDMKNEVAARTAAFGRLARSGFRPRGDLWLLVVSRRGGRPGPDAGWSGWSSDAGDPLDLAVNEGGAGRLVLPDGRVLHERRSARRAPSRPG